MAVLWDCSGGTGVLSDLGRYTRSRSASEVSLVHVDDRNRHRCRKTNREDAMSGKIRIKMGSVEIEYEGSEEFIKGELLAMVGAICDLCKATVSFAGSQDATSGPQSAIEPLSPEAPPLRLSPASVAAKLDCKTGSDLVLAASAYLTFVEHSDSFERAQLLDSMKSATGYYKSSYSNNLSKYLHGLVADGALLQEASGRYALSSLTRRELEQQLAG